MSQYNLRKNNTLELWVNINYGKNTYTELRVNINFVRTPTKNYESI